MKTEDFSGIRNNGPLPSYREVTMPENMQDLVDDYAESTISMLDELERVALAYEAGDNREENGSEVRRILHKIKGESGVVGVDKINELSHEAEYAFEELTENERTDMLLRFKDWTYAAINYLKQAT